MAAALTTCSAMQTHGVSGWAGVTSENQAAARANLCFENDCVWYSAGGVAFVAILSWPLDQLIHDWHACAFLGGEFKHLSQIHATPVTCHNLG